MRKTRRELNRHINTYQRNDYEHYATFENGKLVWADGLNGHVHIRFYPFICVIVEREPDEMSVPSDQSRVLFMPWVGV